MSRSDEYLPRILKHEGGFVDHPADPGGATNRGVTIGTLKRLGIDKDGDGDSDIVDLRLLDEKDAAKVFHQFYAVPVQADLLPIGLDYAMTDFAVNSGPSRAVQHLQRIVGVKDDGHMGPKTLTAVMACDPEDLINRLCDSRLRFMRGLKTWASFGKGWQARVDGVRAGALADARRPAPSPAPEKRPVEAQAPVQVPAPVEQPESLWAALLRAILGIIRGK